MTRRSLVNVLAAFVIAVGGSVLLMPTGARAAEADACCYGACMEYCTPESGFSSCHNLCKRDCEAC